MELKFRNLYASEVEVKLARGNDMEVKLLLYKDARCDQRLLDEKVGAMNWQKRYTNGNTNCIVSIWDTDKLQWVEKEDVGIGVGPDAKKAVASDSFKRACFAWGIGRELYTTPKIMVPKSILNNYREEKDGLYCDNTFRVTTLDCTEDHVITNVVIEVLFDGIVIHTIEQKCSSNAESTLSSLPPVIKVQSTKASGGNPEIPVNTEITEADLAIMYAKAEIAGASQKGILSWINKQFSITDVRELSKEQYQIVCRKLDEQAAKRKSA